VGGLLQGYVPAMIAKSCGVIPASFVSESSTGTFAFMATPFVPRVD
jgi:hypothetical protein